MWMDGSGIKQKSVGAPGAEQLQFEFQQNETPQGLGLNSTMRWWACMAYRALFLPRHEGRQSERGIAVLLNLRYVSSRHLHSGISQGTRSRRKL